MRRRGPSFTGLIYIVIGVVIATNHHYFTNLNGVWQIVSAALAIVLWPLVLLGVNLHIHR